MDEEAYREAYAAYNTVPCPFEKALLTQCCECENFQRLHIADREAAGCNSPTAQISCSLAIELLRDKARFALGLSNIDGKLPHGKEIKVQCGGMRGIQAALANDPPASNETINIHKLVVQSLSTFGSLEALPFLDIVQSIAKHKGRQRRGKS